MTVPLAATLNGCMRVEAQLRFQTERPKKQFETFQDEHNWLDQANVAGWFEAIGCSHRIPPFPSAETGGHQDKAE